MGVQMSTVNDLSGQSCTLGDRLKEERERLGFTQAVFAELAGFSKSAQLNYESGKRAPDAVYLYSVMRMGVDLMYVLTGERQQSRTTVLSTGDGLPTLTAQENWVLGNYRAADETGRRALEAASAALARRSDEKGG